ncbi:hypothetical protein G6F22_021684 [Rhizopus arrhizus]|nr:hypothetical protein G6F22_021684 [Rhizopus arrhizus]
MGGADAPEGPAAGRHPLDNSGCRPAAGTTHAEALRQAAPLRHEQAGQEPQAVDDPQAEEVQLDLRFVPQAAPAVDEGQ